MLKNIEAFTFFDPIIEAGAALFETAGALGDGKRVWVLARIRSDQEIAPGDRISKYLLLSNSHDGKSAAVTDAGGSYCGERAFRGW